MAKTENIEDQLRRAILGSDMSRYRISQLSGVSQGQLSRFVRDPDDPRFRTLTMARAAKVAQVLGLELQPLQRKKRGK